MALFAPVSTVPAAKAFLFTQLQARPELAPPVGVFYDALGKRIPDDWVMVGNVTANTVLAETNLVGSGGRYWLQEEYVVEVTAQAFRGGDVAQVVFERACYLADVVVDVVRTDPSLGGAVTLAMPVRREYNADWSADNLGRVVEVRVEFQCTARI